MLYTTCCFAGHRYLPDDLLPAILQNLDQAIDTLARRGVTDFLSGGDIGFDQIAAAMVIAKRDEGCPLQLHFVLPYPDQDALWSAEQRETYWMLLGRANSVACLSETYTAGCVRARNRALVDRAIHCVCALVRADSNTFQTILYARSKGLSIINVASPAMPS